MTTDIDTVTVTPAIERIIWMGLGRKSVSKIAAETGLHPADVLRIKQEMFDSIDDLTILQRKQKLMVELESIAYDAREAAGNSIDDFKSGLWNSSISAIKALTTELNRMEKADTSKVEALNAMRVKELVSLMYEVVDGGVPVVAARYNLEEDELFEIFNDTLQRAAKRREVDL